MFLNKRGRSNSSKRMLPSPCSALRIVKAIIKKHQGKIRIFRSHFGCFYSHVIENDNFFEISVYLFEILSLLKKSEEGFL